MNILIFGAGAVGGYLGARLANAGQKVTLIARPGAAEAINEIGLSVQTPGGHFFARPQAVPSLRQALLNAADSGYDLLFLAMKAYDVDLALNEMAAFWSDPPTILMLQNGIGVEKPVVAQYSAAQVIAGALTTPVSSDAPGSLKVEKSNRGLGLAPVQKGQDIQRWQALFQGAGIPTMALPDHHTLKWSKAVVNIVANATAAILNRHPRVIYKNPLTFRIEMQMLRETFGIMKKRKIAVVDLPGAPARQLRLALRWLPKSVLQPFLTYQIGRARGDKMPSFFLDLTNEKGHSEVIYHNGAIADAGLAAGRPAPVNATLNDVLIDLVKGRRDPEAFSGQPQRLAAEISRRQQALRERQHAA